MKEPVKPEPINPAPMSIYMPQDTGHPYDQSDLDDSIYTDAQIAQIKRNLQEMADRKAKLEPAPEAGIILTNIDWMGDVVDMQTEANRQLQPYLDKIKAYEEYIKYLEEIRAKDKARIEELEAKVKDLTEIWGDITRQDFLKLPVETRRKVLARQAKILGDFYADSQAKDDLRMME
jgi:hypothetical protein